MISTTRAVDTMGTGLDLDLSSSGSPTPARRQMVGASLPIARSAFTCRNEEFVRGARGEADGRRKALHLDNAGASAAAVLASAAPLEPD